MAAIEIFFQTIVTFTGSFEIVTIFFQYCTFTGSLCTKKLFWVEDFLDDDNSRPYTYWKEKNSKNPTNHVSFKQCTVAYMELFTLDVFISKRFASASLTHRVTSKQVAVAGTNSKDIKKG